MSLLEEAKQEDIRLKMLIYGEPGTGKTVTSLHFPSPAVIDPEKGTNHYAKYFKFKKIHSSEPAVVANVVNELLAAPGGVKTFVIDPFTLVYDKMVQNQESRMKIKYGNPNYTLQPADYKVIKSEMKALVDKILSLDMNIIVTARSSTLYSTEEFMKAEGTKADGPKDLPYLFDVVLELKKDKTTGKFIAITHKDRTNTLPTEFEFAYSSFVQYVGLEGLEREPVVFKQIQQLNERTGRKRQVTFNEKPVMTAGVSGEQLEKIAKLTSDYGSDLLLEKIKGDYFVDSILDLKEDEARLLIHTITEELKKKD